MPEPRGFVARVVEPVANAIGRSFQVFFFTFLILGISSRALEFVGNEATAGFLWKLAEATLVLAIITLGVMFLLAMIFD